MKQSDFNSHDIALLTRRWVEGIWSPSNRQNAIDSIDPECEFLGWGKGVQGKLGWLETVAKFEDVFDPILVTVVDVVGSDGQGSGHARFAARHRASQRETDVFFSFFLRWDNEMLTWSRSILDTASLLAQLNLLDLKRWDIVFEAPHFEAEGGP